MVKSKPSWPVPAASPAAGVNPSDWKKRKGLMDKELPLAEVAEAHRVSERGHARGKLVLLVGAMDVACHPAG
jgi:hypothetical protein